MPKRNMEDMNQRTNDESRSSENPPASCPEKPSMSHLENPPTSRLENPSASCPGKPLVTCPGNTSMSRLENPSASCPEQTPTTLDEDGIDTTDIKNEITISKSIKDVSTNKAKTSIWKKSIYLSIAFFCVFSAFIGLVGLQSSINCEAGLGFTSLLVINTFNLSSGLLIPPVVIACLGYKLTLALSLSCYIIYTGVNFYPSWFTIMPASALLGVAASNLWTVQASYLATFGQELSNITGRSVELTTNKLIAIFYAIFGCSDIMGYILPSVIYHHSHNGLVSNQTATTNVTTIDIYTCGSNDCHQTNGNTTTYCNPPDRFLTNILLGTYIGLEIIALVIVIIFVDDVRKETRGNTNNNRKTLKKFGETVKLWLNYRMVLLIPLPLYIGFSFSFFYGDFTKSYISCTLGVDKIGYILICGGVTFVFMQLLLSQTGKKCGRVFPMAISLLAYLSCYILLWTWEPKDWNTNLIVFLVSCILFVVGDSIVYIETSTIYAVVFPDNKEAAYANMWLWRAVGNIIGFGMSLSLCVYVKIGVLMTLTVLAWSCYIAVEYIHHSEKTSNNTKYRPVNLSSQGSHGTKK